MKAQQWAGRVGRKGWFSVVNKVPHYCAYDSLLVREYSNNNAYPISKIRRVCSVLCGNAWFGDGFWKKMKKQLESQLFLKSSKTINNFKTRKQR